MKEIGGYFGLEQFSGREYHGDLIGVNSGRNALLYILKAKQVKKLYIPRFLCDSVSRLCQREGYAFAEYPIAKDFMPVFAEDLGDGEYLYVVNYYGQISNDRIRELKARFGNLIVDNVQAFFQRPVPGVDTVYSCRKFFGVPDGGYVATDGIVLEPLDPDVSADRMKHVLGRYEDSAAAYYEDFKRNDEIFYDLPLRMMSRITANILRGIDYRAVREQRNANYALLHSLLGEQNVLQLTAPDGPYCYPFYCKNGMEVKKHLAANSIFVPTLWPNLLTGEAPLEADYAQNILPLPCDQRYGSEDMERMATVLQKIISR